MVEKAGLAELPLQLIDVVDLKPLVRGAAGRFSQKSKQGRLGGIEQLAVLPEECLQGGDFGAQLFGRIAGPALRDISLLVGHASDFTVSVERAPSYDCAFIFFCLDQRACSA